MLRLCAVLATLFGAGLLTLTAFAQSGSTSPPSDTMSQGAMLFQNNCAACHQGDGSGAGPFPALSGNAFVTVEPPEPLIRLVITGRGGMPRFGNALSNNQLAAVLTYVRNSWGNSAPAVSAEQVQQVRTTLANELEESEGGGQREGNESSSNDGDGD
jgi:cytochrome c6